MNNNFLTNKLCDMCRTDDLPSFNLCLKDDFKKYGDELILHSDILRAILSTKKIFQIFLTEYHDDKSNTEFFAHPLLYQLFNFALLNFSAYENHIFKILNFGIAHNLNISKQLCCDRILQNGNLIYNNKTIGRAVMFSATEPLDGTDELFAKLDELNDSVKAIKAKQLYLAGGYSGLSVNFADGLIEKERTFNDCEYTLLKLLEENGYSKVPKYLGVKNGKDIFSYIVGKTIAYTYEMSKPSIVKITNELKTINTISKKYLKDKVYVHGDLGTQNVVFNDYEVAGIIDWDNTFIGEEYDDFIYVFWVWANVGNIKRNDDRMFGLLKTMIDAYQPDDRFRNNFSNKIWQRMERKLKEIPVDSNIYSRIHDWVKWSQVWVEKYNKRISNEIG